MFYVPADGYKKDNTPHCENADKGMHSFTYSLFPHCRDFRKGSVVKEGYALNIPLEISKAPANNGRDVEIKVKNFEIVTLKYVR